jgi:hypothetical protein
MASRPRDTDYASYYSRYVNLVPGTDVLSVLRTQIVEFAKLAAAVSHEREGFRYAEGKWSIREVIGHLIDGERVFGFRAFCFSRGEQAHLPSFDENEYVAASRSDDRTLADLIAELTLVRQSNLAVLEHLAENDWERRGTASDNPVTVLALAFMMAGHVRHHLDILRIRYGIV